MIIKSYKISVLVISCILLLITLSCIQYYLVSNTYRLTKESYFKEITAEMNKVSKMEPIPSININAANQLLKLINPYQAKKISATVFIKQFKAFINKDKALADRKVKDLISHNPLLKGMRYRLQYEEITFEQAGVTDTLLSSAQEPFIYIGGPFSNAYQIGNPNEYIEIKSDGNAGIGYFSLKLKASSYLDISSWQRQVLIRMSSVFILAAALIVAVLLLFYLILSALLRQKKIAEIKTDFANNITHELKTPLSSVGLIIKSLKREEIYTDQATVLELLDTLDRQNIKILHIVDSVLETAMGTAAEIELTATDVTACLQKYTTELALPSHKLVIEIENNQQLLLIHPPTLEKILNQLLENAAKYSDEGTIITLKAGKDKTSYNIAVIDQGPGIKDKDQKYIFDKFFRVTEGSKQTLSGLGLGLYLSKIAASQLQGSISLKSIAGHGATFTIKLPLYETL